jgi:hypothetical protein
VVAQAVRWLKLGVADGSGTSPIHTRDAELRSLSEDEVIRRHDHWAALIGPPGTQDIDGRQRAFLEHYHRYVNELARRDAERQGNRMEALTPSMHWLTGVGVAVAIVGVFIATVNLACGS